MQNYEGMFIINPTLSTEETDKTIAAIEEEITKNGGEIRERNPWGRRRLAYPIKRQREGFYYRLGFRIAQAAIDQLKKVYELKEPILRVMIVVDEKEGK